MKTLVLIATLAFVAGIAHADTAVLQESATRQEQVRIEGQDLVAKLDELMAEYTRNGVATGDDFDVLKEVRDKLGSLSDGEMEEVVTLLNEAQGGKEDDMVKAFSEQKDISLKLKEVLAAHEREQDVEALANAVRQLADREGTNISAAIEAKHLAEQDNSENGRTAVTASVQAQQAEQAAIAAEVKLLAAKLDQVAADADKYKDAATQLDAVQPRAQRASDTLNAAVPDTSGSSAAPAPAAKLGDAITTETQVRDKLDEIAVAIMPLRGDQDVTSQKMGQIGDLAREQQELMTKTALADNQLRRVQDDQTQFAADQAMAAAVKRPTAALAREMAQQGVSADSSPDQIRNLPAMQEILAARAGTLKKQADVLAAKLAALAADQEALAGRAQLVRDDLQRAGMSAAAPMAEAVAQMANAQTLLTQANGDAAVLSESAAAVQLGLAQKLAAQSAPAGQPNAAAAQPTAQQLQKEIAALAAREAAAMQQPGPTAAAAASLQRTLAALARQLEQAAASGQPGSPAAQPLQDAGDAMESAAQAIQNGGTPAAGLPDEQKAGQTLADAARQLAQAANAEAARQQQWAAMQKQEQALGRLIQEQQQVNLATDRSLGKQGVEPTVLARQQGNVQNDSATVGKASNNPDVTKSLGDAHAAMSQAIQKLNDEGEQEAQPAEQSALASLYKAQDAVADKMRRMAQAMGEAPQLAQALKNAEASLASAQKAAAAGEQAMNSGQKGALRSAAAQWGAAMRSATMAGSQLQALPQGARDAIRQAQQALSAATDSALTGSRQQAREQAEQGAQALAAARAALAQSQDGIGPLADSEGQGQMENGKGENGQASQPQGPPSGGPPPKAGGGTGADERGWKDLPGAAQAATGQAHDEGAFLALPARDRAAIRQSQMEKYPEEYGELIEEYMKRLSSDAGGTQQQ